MFQNAVCNWRCWYCYVDFELLSGRSDRSALISAEELVQLYMAETRRPPIIDLSGGQPDLVPEWIPWMIEALSQNGMADQVYLWSDDNLSTDYYFSCLTAGDRNAIERHRMYGKVCCFKGFDAVSFAFNTQAHQDDFTRQFDLMRRLVRETSLDLYAYVTFTGPPGSDPATAMPRFVDRLQEISPALPLRTVPLRVGVFTPVQGRLGRNALTTTLEIQETAIRAWNSELQRRFSTDELSHSICDAQLRE